MYTLVVACELVADQANGGHFEHCTRVTNSLSSFSEVYNGLDFYVFISYIECAYTVLGHSGLTGNCTRNPT